MRFITILKSTLGVLLAFCLSQSAVAGKGQGSYSGRIDVMTQNLYVGANLFQILEGTPEDVPFNAAMIFGDIQMTDFQQRAEAIADLVLEHEPQLIGLQEVSLIRTQCPDDIVFPPNDPTPNATDIYADYLQILLDSLAARGLSYDVDDVTLSRSDVEVTLSISGNYQANFPVPTPSGPIVFTRGYNIVDVDIEGRSYRFANTHLEVDGNPFANGFQFAQAYELTQILNGMAGTFGDEIVVVVGDLNSGPDDGPLVDCMLPPAFDTPGLCPTSYAVMAGNGYTDSWTVRNGAPGPGYTCCQADLLMNAVSWLDRRIDHVWVRPPLAGPQGPHFLRGVHAEVAGDRQDDRTVDGLWPSDHAGVVVGLTLRQSK
jgi:endonuclease/exonuclease/phosphatase family metal-dependent hydrolase